MLREKGEDSASNVRHGFRAVTELEPSKTKYLVPADWKTVKVNKQLDLQFTTFRFFFSYFVLFFVSLFFSACPARVILLLPFFFGSYSSFLFFSLVLFSFPSCFFFPWFLVIGVFFTCSFLSFLFLLLLAFLVCKFKLYYQRFWDETVSFHCISNFVFAVSAVNPV